MWTCERVKRGFTDESAFQQVEPVAPPELRAAVFACCKCQCLQRCQNNLGDSAKPISQSQQVDGYLKRKQHNLYL